MTDERVEESLKQVLEMVEDAAARVEAAVNRIETAKTWWDLDEDKREAFLSRFKSLVERAEAAADRLEES